MNKFKVGDKARVKYVRDGVDTYWKVGVIVEIISLETGYDDDYIKGTGYYECTVRLSNNTYANPLIDQLEPIVPEKGSWKTLEAELGWNPTKVKQDV